MKNDTIDALELLKSQHQEVEELMEMLEKSEDPGKKSEMFTELADKLAAHATIEEKIFYPGVKAEATQELLVESVEEHLSVKRLLADMMELSVEDESFDAKLSVLKEQVHHHAIEEEEGEMFPKVRKLMSKDELAAMGNEMMAMFETLMEGDPRLNIPSETTEAAPI
ncbi:MAG: hemerythrin domain-containing protein [Kofleriaceae bacterium]